MSILRVLIFLVALLVLTVALLSINTKYQAHLKNIEPLQKQVDLEKQMAKSELVREQRYLNGTLIQWHSVDGNIVMSQSHTG